MPGAGPAQRAAPDALIWISPPLPGARHDMGAARVHAIIDALNGAGVQTLADTAHRGGRPSIRVPATWAPPRLGHWSSPEAHGGSRRLTADQKEVNTAHARRRGPAERANAEIKNWKILRKI